MTQISVYKNLHKNCYSLKTGGYVAAHSKKVWMKDVKFIVNEAGRDKVRRTGVKNVHAYVRGHLGAPPESQRNHLRKAYYNPKIHDTFIDVETKLPLTKASYVLLDDSGVFYRV